MGLYESWTYSLKDLGLGGILSKKFKLKNTQSPSILHEPTIRALYYTAKETDIAVGKGKDSYDNEFIVVEKKREDDTIIVVLSDKRVSAAIWDGNDSQKYQLAKSRQDGSEIIAALIPELLGKEEFRTNYENFKAICGNTRLEELKDKMDADESVGETMFLLCGMVYEAIESEKRLIVGRTITTISAESIKQGLYLPDATIFGTFGKSKINKNNATMESDENLAKGFVLNSSRVYSDEETALIPRLPDWFIVPDYLVNACKMVTAKLSRPVRNIMFRGEAGTGKTETAKAMAAMLHMPYVSLCCHPDMTINDFTGTILPKLNGSQAAESVEMEKYPSFQDISMDPSYAFEQMTGEAAPDDITEEMVFSMVVRKAAESMQTGNTNIQYEYCDSTLVQAIKKGWLIEIQEPAIIERPGVLTGLNSLLDTCQSVTLPTGEVVKRHPDCIIVVTTNTSYQGCKEMNNSVISRMQFVKDTELPDDTELKERIEKITGFSDDVILSRMISVVHEIHTFCQERMITDGTCGVRELVDWVQGYQALNDVVEAALISILPKASADPESQHEIKIACLDPKFYKN